MKTKRNYSWTNPKTRMAIVADRAAGLSCTAIAKKYEVDKATVSRICLKFRQEVPQAEMSVDLDNWKEQLKAEAIAAVLDALKCQLDAYKRGGIGIQVLKGTGEFVPDAMQVNHFDINSIPVELRSRYITSTVEDEQKEKDRLSVKLLGPVPQDSDSE